jgi:hypothetical protein
MGDEIEQLKANVISISDRLAALPGKPDVRFATTVFRDRGDAFVARTFDFTPDVKAFQGALRAVVADGGGDTPESVNTALHDAIHKPSWRGGQTVSLAFLIGDAAPHLDYPDDADYAVEVFEAAKRGIKIEPIASSGLDDQGEFVFRQLAQLTGGRFSFLTYGAAGVPRAGRHDDAPRRRLLGAVARRPRRPAGVRGAETPHPVRAAVTRSRRRARARSRTS